MSWKGRLLFAVLNGLFFTLLLCILDLFSPSSYYTWPSLIFQGVTFGLLMGLGMPYFFTRVGNRFLQVAPPELESDELLSFEGPANLFRGKEAVGGRLFLTTHRLIFVSHNLNIQNGTTLLDLNQIVSLSPRKTLGLIQNGLTIQLEGGKDYHFVVYNPDLWQEKIENAVAELLTASKIKH